MQMVNVVLVAFAGVILLLNAFSYALQRISIPGPVPALGAGVLIGPYGLDLLRLDDFAPDPHRLLEEVTRITLAVGLAGVALRLPDGYWRRRWRWVLASVGLGMLVMFATAAGILSGLLGVPILVAIVIAAVITPTDPIVSTPIVTGRLSLKKIPSGVRSDISSESGLNDGLAYLLVFAPVLLLTASPGQAWTELFTRVLLWEVGGAVIFGALIGVALGWLFRFVYSRKLMEKTSMLGFVLAAALFTLGALKLIGTDGVLGVFIAVAVFGVVAPREADDEQDEAAETANRFVAIPSFVLLGMALPFDEWIAAGPSAFAAVLAALVLRRIVAVWVTRPVYASLHTRAETAFMSWFGPVGISALFYATLSERLTGETEIFTFVTMTIAASVVVHGLTSAPLSTWMEEHSSAASRVEV